MALKIERIQPLSRVDQRLNLRLWAHFKSAAKNRKRFYASKDQKRALSERVGEFRQLAEKCRMRVLVREHLRMGEQFASLMVDEDVQKAVERDPGILRANAEDRLGTECSHQCDRRSRWKSGPGGIESRFA